MRPLKTTSRTDGPTLMPNRHWLRPPSAPEERMMALWEEKYICARCVFENDPASADLLFDHTPGAVTPNHYIDWLRESYHHYMRHNVGEHPSMARNYRKELHAARQAGYMVPGEQPQPLGSAPLTVGRYGDRVYGPARSFDAQGVRLDAHHTPHDTMTHLPRYEGTAVAIPEDVHKFLHRVRDRHRAQESTYENVNLDFALILRELSARGYRPEDVRRAKAAVHDRNEDLGVYRHTKRDAPYR